MTLDWITLVCGVFVCSKDVCVCVCERRSGFTEEIVCDRRPSWFICVSVLLDCVVCRLVDRLNNVSVLSGPNDPIPILTSVTPSSAHYLWLFMPVCVCACVEAFQGLKVFECWTTVCMWLRIFMGLSASVLLCISTYTIWSSEHCSTWQQIKMSRSQSCSGMCVFACVILINFTT